MSSFIDWDNSGKSSIFAVSTDVMSYSDFFSRYTYVAKCRYSENYKSICIMGKILTKDFITDDKTNKVFISSLIDTKTGDLDKEAFRRSMKHSP